MPIAVKFLGKSVDWHHFRCSVTNHLTISGNQKMTEKRHALIVTRHQGLVDWLRERGWTGDHIPHAGAEEVEGRVVVGVLPMHLAALTSKFISATIKVPVEARGREWSKEELEVWGCSLHWYIIADHGAYDED